MECISENRLVTKYEIRPKQEVRSFTYCEGGDLLLSKITPSFENGKQGFVPKDVSFALATTEVYPLYAKSSDFELLYLFYYLKLPKVRNLLASLMTGTTGRKRVPKSALENLLVPLPSLPEQKEIASRLKAVDDLIETKREEKERLERAKKKVMELLLTGKVRVKSG
jgi:type I restriction enzyme S subunit